MANTKKITRKAFEAELKGKYPSLDISPWSEFDYTSNRDRVMTLYYSEGVHVATWQEGEGWYVESV